MQFYWWRKPAASHW